MEREAERQRKVQSLTPILEPSGLSCQAPLPSSCDVTSQPLQVTSCGSAPLPGPEWSPLGWGMDSCTLIRAALDGLCLGDAGTGHGLPQVCRCQHLPDPGGTFSEPDDLSPRETA